MSVEQTAPHHAKDWEWVARMCSGTDGADAGPFGLVLINTPLPESRIRHLWGFAKTRICADGAADRLNSTCSDLLPDILVGDLDSASSEIVEAYKGRGVDVRDLSHDQDSTDLEKALSAASEAECERIVVAGQFAGVEGRLDHTFGIANTLRMNAHLQIAVIADDSFMFLLEPGEHRILVPGASSAPHCGLVPLGTPCTSISTTGLQWNMTDARMEFGGLVSVCNRVDPSAEGRVWVKTSTHVLWTCTLPKQQ